MRTPIGKIGRLPVSLRNQVNIMIRDNRPHKDILALLAENGVTNIIPMNISTWKGGGYQEWERRQERLDGMSARREFAANLVKQAATEGDSELSLVSDAASAIAVDSIQQVLEDFDPTSLRDTLAEKPALFMKLTDALANLRKGDQAMVKLRMEYDDYRRKIRDNLDRLAAMADTKGGATAEDIKTIFKEAYGV